MVQWTRKTSIKNYDDIPTRFSYPITLNNLFGISIIENNANPYPNYHLVTMALFNDDNQPNLLSGINIKCRFSTATDYSIGTTGSIIIIGN